MRWLNILIIICLTFYLEGQEAILVYDVDIRIQSDGRIVVTENLRVRAEGHQIKRGIFRAIPTIRPDKSGRNEPAPIEIISVKRDGQKEPYHLKKTRENLTVYIGEESALLEPGEYTYELTYLAENQIGFFEAYDELYWNVIGQDWSFPVRDYSATIHMPDGAGFIQGSCYTGSIGSKASSCILTREKGADKVYIEGTKPLRPQEGFTIAIAWEKGFTNENGPGSYDLSIINIFLYAFGLMIFLFYSWRLWKKVGEDPPKVAVVPSWNPPQDYSPAENSYIYHRSITNEAISAALVSAAVKGAIQIKNRKKRFTFYRLSDSTSLAPEEKALVDGILPPGEDSFVLKSSSYSRYKLAKQDFIYTLKNRLNITDYFRKNWGQGIRAILLMAVVVTMALSIGMYPLLSTKFHSMLVLFGVTFLSFVIISLLFRIKKWYKWLFILPAWLAMMVLSGFIYSQLIFYSNSTVWIAVIMGISLFSVGLFNFLIYAPTQKGQNVMAQVTGFRIYLDKSEKALLEYFTPPKKTPELFEKMLPFAIALGVENRWSKKFKKILDEAIEQGTYSPVWYSGNIHKINSFHSNFQSSVSHAAPKSSSGSGGGGFSGGGGGGGGGGGW